MTPNTSRSQNYIDTPVQGALLKRIFCHWCGFFLVAAIATIAMQVLLGDPAASLAQRFMSELKSFSLVGLVMLSLLPAFMLDTIRFSNRFVGPVGRLRNGLRKLQAGELERIQFRGNDFWFEMGNEFNAVVELLERQRQQIEQLNQDSMDRSAEPSETMVGS